MVNQKSTRGFWETFCFSDQKNTWAGFTSTTHPLAENIVVKPETWSATLHYEATSQPIMGEWSEKPPWVWAFDGI